MARFARKRHSRNHAYVRLVAAVLVIVAFGIGIHLISVGDVNRQEKNLRQALENDITACYSMEGRYPESLSYLKQNYGLIYNEKMFYVDYQVTGSNIRPVVTVIRRDAASEDQE
ncbi:hypothetical protein ACTQZS_11710 [Bilifractor sp. LCP19S3_H10]|uniref:hypothetical protein n=1 Tax=Bilifractor sp. LCP19S3_H10 TaxID=3438736 RepID=UPI003F93D78C